jgi:hypothetical protein
MKITFTNTSSTTVAEVGRYVIPAGGTLQVDFSASSAVPPTAVDIADLQNGLTLNQLSCVTDVLVPQGLGGIGQYVAGTTYATNPVTLTTVLSLLDAVQLQAAFSATPTIDLGQGVNVIMAPVTANITAITITNPPPAGTYVNFIIPMSGVFTITWPASFKKAADGVAANTKRGLAAFVYDGTYYNQVGGAVSFN